MSYDEVGSLAVRQKADGWVVESVILPSTSMSPLAWAEVECGCLDLVSVSRAISSQYDSISMRCSGVEARARRLFAVVVSMLCNAPNSAATSSAPETVQSHAYGGNNSARVSRAWTARAARPSLHYPVVDRWSHGVSPRLGLGAPPTDYTYDDPARLVRAAP